MRYNKLLQHYFKTFLVDLNGQVGHAQVDGAFIASGNGRMGKIVSDDLPVGYIWPLDKSPEEQDEEGMIAFNPVCTKYDKICNIIYPFFTQMFFPLPKISKF